MTGTVLSFGPFALDPAGRRLSRGGDAVTLTDRHLDVLLHLVSHAGTVLSKDALVAAAWQGVAVSDNSLEQVVSSLRRTLGDGPDGQPYIQTLARRGYRFAAPVSTQTRRASDDELEALLAPHRAFLEGRAALETLARDQVLAARDAFARVLQTSPDHASAHVGMANAAAFLFEASRADRQPDVEALSIAVGHAREACRLDPASAEAWATFAFTMHRGGDPQQALAAGRHAVSLEPDNWKHHLRLAFVSWGEERLRAADRTLKLLPGLALAHWLAATVHVARQSLDAALRDLDAGARAQDAQQAGVSRFSGVGLHWLRGLVLLERGDTDEARAAFQRELSFEQDGHLYARECCANAWYAIGAMHHRDGDRDSAARAFQQVLDRVGDHPMALAALTALSSSDAERATRHASFVARMASLRTRGLHVEAALAESVSATVNGDRRPAIAALTALDAAFAATTSSSAAWFLPIEPMLRASQHAALSQDALSQDALSQDTALWQPLLAAIRARAA